MPLVTCPDCGKEISDAAPACIHCGRPMRYSAPLAAPEQSPRSPVRTGIWLGVGMFIVLPVIVVVLAALFGVVLPSALLADPALFWSMVVGGGLVMVGVVAKALLGD